MKWTLPKIALWASLVGSSHAFAPTSRPVRTLVPTTSRQPTRIASDAIVGEECIITPEGFGFSTPTKRVLKEANRNDGFYPAQASDQIIDVMQAITTGTEDVALVYEGAQLLGLFTESDYIRVSSAFHSHHV